MNVFDVDVPIAIKIEEKEGGMIISEEGGGGISVHYVCSPAFRPSCKIIFIIGFAHYRHRRESSRIRAALSTSGVVRAVVR
jgi:hypothetical protein